MTKPSILLIPSSLALPSFNDPIVDAIAAQAYSILTLHLPSVGLSALQGRAGPPPTLYDDAAFIAATAEALANEGKDVLLIGHSYGGVPVTQSMKGLAREERTKEGERGGVVRLAYTTCLVPGVLSGVPEGDRAEMRVDENGWMYHDPPSATAAITSFSLSPEEGTAWIRKFPKHSAVSFVGELTYPGYEDVPVSYLLCEEDRCIMPGIQRVGIEMVARVSGRKVDVTSIKADHCPNITAEGETVEWILDVARKAEQ